MDEEMNFVWTDLFFEDGFDIDQFLTKYTQEDDLETLRASLRKYGTHLHDNMTEILKTETEEILEVAEALTELFVKIDNLIHPVGKLTKLIENIYEAANIANKAYYLAEERFEKHKDDQRKLNLMKELESEMSMIGKSFEIGLFSNISYLERIVNLYSSQSGSSTSEDVNKEKKEKMENELLKPIHNIFIESINQNDFNIILRCLRMYENLGKEKEAEVEYRNKTVRPAMEQIFNANYLKTECNGDLDILYQNALKFIENEMHILHDVVCSSDLKTFDFLLHSYWSEVDILSREGLPNITAPGNPELFQTNFISTKKFLTNIATLSGSPHILTHDSSFVDHLYRFNLPVYFEIRHQQIACQFEKEIALHTNENVYLDEENNEYKFKLATTSALWKSIIRCFADDVYIEELNVKFTFLTTLIFSRYFKWLGNILEDPSKYQHLESDWDKFVMSVLYDLDLSQDPVNVPVPSISTCKIPIPIEINRCEIKQFRQKYKKGLIKKKISDILPILKTVTSVPRYYRRTNRNAPESASSYMIDAVKLITLFYTNFHEFSNDFQPIFNSIVTETMDNFMSMVKEVLTSVSKTEDTLRRLKKNNTGTSDELPKTDGISDDMKIRTQIQLDVKYFLSQIQDNVSMDIKKSINELVCDINI